MKNLSLLILTLIITPFIYCAQENNPHVRRLTQQEIETIVDGPKYATAEITDKLKKENRINASDSLGRTMLFYALDRKPFDYRVLNNLLRAGADPSAADIKDITALRYAVEKGNSAAVATMIGKGEVQLAKKPQREILLEALYRADELANSADQDAEKQYAQIIFLLEPEPAPEGHPRKYRHEDDR
jgi:hypothetical protein